LETGLDRAAEWARTGRIVDPDSLWRPYTDARYATFRAVAEAAIP
jgi:hypothetical protein